MPEIAFAGRSNVGKSSLLNRLFNRKALARVSSVPGKTATINFYKVDDARFVDLPGYGYAKVSKSEKIRWAEMLEGYFKTGRNIRLVVQLIDMRHKPSADDLMMIDFLRSTGYPFVIVMTKSDKLNKTQFAERSAAIYDEIPDSENVTIIPGLHPQQADDSLIWFSYLQSPQSFYIFRFSTRAGHDICDNVVVYIRFLLECASSNTYIRIAFNVFGKNMGRNQ